MAGGQGETVLLPHQGIHSSSSSFFVGCPESGLRDISVPWPRPEPESQQWKPRILTTRPGNSPKQPFLNCLTYLSILFRFPHSWQSELWNPRSECAWVNVCTHQDIPSHLLKTSICPQEFMGFPDSSVDKESACDAGNPCSIPGSGRSTGEGTGYPLQYSDLKNSMDWIPKSWTWLSAFHFPFHSWFIKVSFNSSLWRKPSSPWK